MKNMRVEVFLKNGQILRTEDAFEDEADACTSIVEEIDSRDSSWKDIGHLTLHFMEIAGFSVEVI